MNNLLKHTRIVNISNAALKAPEVVLDRFAFSVKVKVKVKEGYNKAWEKVNVGVE